MSKNGLSVLSCPHIPLIWIHQAFTLSQVKLEIENSPICHYH
jgi:hypothetical protein